MKSCTQRYYAPLFFLVALMFVVSVSFLIGKGDGPAFERVYIAERAIVETDVGGRYHIDVQYPELRGWRDREAQKKVNSIVLASVLEELDAFRSAVLESDSSVARSRESALVVTYAIEQMPTITVDSQAREGGAPVPLLSIRFVHSPYYAGAAHPDGHASGVTFRLDTGEQVRLENFFVSPEAALSHLAGRAVEELRKQLAPFTGGSDRRFGDQISRGTTPTKDHYKHFVMGENGLVLIFNPYQVAPYVFGILDVKVSWGELAEILRPEWRFLARD
ncbi:MAG: hypothetical protein COV10_02440 [Candidatus Vogelbacteria bacterium CG10_big_fil_rev_8_21_14_0_10_51_16]|uniref:DUF3298 domain-containing protein n=1 Tax=Candidatus Vogelbacteria bacterium CG10_big_fil_rev_8_21_14_0_10_51_16 TaxID=1975045 RepID=A0A2H0REB0_9BACT|nr:MAG: hypothetical protein COV10_02440 [Candidatus Vogelbacteria bacterium CG10_big_fil_rev_8_21_14_0_10_51_16]